MWDGRPDKNCAASGAMNGLQCAAALAQMPDLDDKERSQIFNECKALFSNKSNNWGKYTYKNEIDYVAKNGYTTGRWGDMSTVSNITKNKSTGADAIVEVAYGKKPNKKEPGGKNK